MTNTRDGEMDERELESKISQLLDAEEGALRCSWMVYVCDSDSYDELDTGGDTASVALAVALETMGDPGPINAWVERGEDEDGNDDNVLWVEWPLERLRHILVPAAREVLRQFGERV
jgi:hypothetical protein